MICSKIFAFREQWLFSSEFCPHTALIQLLWLCPAIHHTTHWLNVSKFKKNTYYSSVKNTLNSNLWFSEQPQIQDSNPVKLVVHVGSILCLVVNVFCHLVIVYCHFLTVCCHVVRVFCHLVTVFFRAVSKVLHVFKHGCHIISLFWFVVKKTV